LIKTTFGVQMLGYIIPEEFNSMITTQKQLTPKKLVFNMDVEKTRKDLVDVPAPGQTVGIEAPKDVFSISVGFPFTMNAGTGVSLSSDGVGFDGSSPVTQTVSIGQPVATTDDVTFSQVSASSLVFGNPTTFTYQGISGSIAITGSLTTSGDLTVQGDATVAGTLTAKEIHTQFVSASILFQSGSTKLGDTIDDTHEYTGSLSTSGSFILNGYTIDEISNDSTLGDESTTAVPTEYAVKAYADTLTTDQAYLRKSYYKTSASVLSTTTASFTAVTASAPTGVTETTEHDFIFFINGQYMEHDAIAIEQSGSSLLLKVDNDSIGYALESDDEIIGIGKFNS